MDRSVSDKGRTNARPDPAEPGCYPAAGSRRLGRRNHGTRDSIKILPSVPRCIIVLWERGGTLVPGHRHRAKHLAPIVRRRVSPHFLSAKCTICASSRNTSGRRRRPPGLRGPGGLAASAGMPARAADDDVAARSGRAGRPPGGRVGHRGQGTRGGGELGALVAHVVQGLTELHHVRPGSARRRLPEVPRVRCGSARRRRCPGPAALRTAAVPGRCPGDDHGPREGLGARAADDAGAAARVDDQAGIGRALSHGAGYLRVQRPVHLRAVTSPMVLRLGSLPWLRCLGGVAIHVRTLSPPPSSRGRA